jgi:hypothetical protein
LKNFTKLELGTILTGISMVVGATVFLTTLRNGQSALVDRIQELEDGVTLEQSRQEAIQDLEEVAQSYKVFEIPVGSIIPFYGNEAPAGYLICNGGHFAKSSAPRLYALFMAQSPEHVLSADTAKVPDLTGMFLRGAGREVGEDSPSQVGRRESQSLGDHNHTYSRINRLFASHKQGSPPNGWRDVPVEGTSALARSGEGGAPSNKFGVGLQAAREATSNAGGETEIRPSNVSVNFIIKM